MALLDGGGVDSVHSDKKDIIRKGGRDRGRKVLIMNCFFLLKFPPSQILALTRENNVQVKTLQKV